MKARTWQQIQAQIIAEKDAQNELSGLTSTSQVAYWKLWTFIVAVAIMLFEQIMVIFEGEVEDLLSKNVPATAAWVQNEVLKFQYDATTPQIAELQPDFTIGYTTVNTSMRIVTNCAVVPSLTSSLVLIKVAKGGTSPTPLSTLEANALSSYVDTFLPVGTRWSLVNANSDKLQLNATVYYNGQYSSTIQSTVEAALNNYMATLPFNGIVKITDLQIAVKNVAGVSDIVIDDLICTPDGGSPIYLIQTKTELDRQYQTYAGYIVNDGTNPFSSTITYTIG